MSLIQMRFFSEELNMFTQANIILPLPRDPRAELRDLPVLYLLHGMGDDCTAWLRKTAIERYALQHGLAVVMPDGGLSCWEDMVHGGRYRSYITKELPNIIRENFPVSIDREKTFIAGCSMGGFGALKLGLSRPESYAAIGCFSAAHMEYQPDSFRNKHMLELVYGDKLAEIEAQMERDALKPDKPRLSVWHACGDADVLKDNALRTRDFMEKIPGLDYHFEMLPGRHNWALWDEMTSRFIRSLKLPEPEVALL